MKRKITSVLLFAALLLCTSCKSKAEDNIQSTVTTQLTTTADSISETTFVESETSEVEQDEVTEVTESDITEAVFTEEISEESIAPTADNLQALFAARTSGEILDNGKYLEGEAAPSGGVDAFYVDIDGDAEKEFCFIWHTNHGSTLYVCEYIDSAWKPVDVLTIVPKYTYLQETDNGTELLAIIGNRAVEGITSYTYNGVENFFELFDIEETGFDDTVYHSMIEDAVSNYTNITPLYDLPHASSSAYFTIANMYKEGVNIDAEEATLELSKFTVAVKELFN